VTVNDVLPVLVDRIVSRFAPERIVLFGSQARGDARADSDLDLLVVMGDEAIDRRRTAIEVRVSLADLPLPMDILVTTPGELARRAHVNGSVFGPALTEGRVLYARDGSVPAGQLPNFITPQGPHRA
jgi:predicted nucleotidyltransferase